jgi:HEAT repeat protein
MRYLGSSTSIEASVRDLESPSVRVRVEAAERLGRVPPEERDRAAAALRPRLEDHSPDVRYMTALSLGRLQDREAVEALSRMARDEDEPMPRQAAISALGEIGDPSAAEILIEALRSSAAEVRFQAAIALPRVAPEAAVEPLGAALDDDDAEVRACAAAALGDLGHEGSRDRLVELLSDPEQQVRMEAATALSRMGDRRGTAVLIHALQDRDFRLLAAEHLFRCPDPAARGALNSALVRWMAPPLLKVWAAGALVKLGDEQARSHLVRLLHHKNEPVRGLAIQVLGAIDQPWSRTTLESLLEPKNAQDFAGWGDEIREALAGRRSGTPSA